MIDDFRVTQQSINNTYSNGLLTKPTPLHSMYMSGMGGFITGYKFVGDVYRKSVGLPENKQLKETLELIEREKNVEGQSLGQRSLNWIGDMVGYSISPPVLALGGIGGAVAKGISLGARAIAPKAVIPFLDRQVGTGIISGKPFTVGEIGERLSGGVLAGELSMIPLAFAEGTANTAHQGGALGFAISSIPILLGMRKGLKVSKEIEQKKPEISGISEKSEIPQEMSIEDKWHHDYENNLDSKENLQVRATKILKDQGLEVNPVTHEVNFQLLNENDVRNLQAAVTDSITSNVSDSNKNNLIDYIINNRIDELRSNPKSQTILRAYDEYISGKLAMKESIIADADKIVANRMKEKILNKTFLSQPEIEKSIKQLSREESHVSQLPFTMPENLEKRIKIIDKIDSLKKKIKKEEKLEEFEMDHINKFGITIARSKHGEITFSNLSSEHPRIVKSEIKKEYRGKGYGKKLYKNAIDYYFKQGKKIISDDILSQDAMRVYRSLIKEGYKFKENETVFEKLSVKDKEKKYASKDEKPIFELISIPKRNKSTIRRINELKSKLPKVLTPKEELSYLYERILKGKEYHNKLKSRAYQRLQELADHWPQARAVMERIHLEEEFEKQQAIKDAFSKLRQEVEKPIDRSARPEDVITYLKERIEGIKPRKNPIGEKPKTPEQVIQESSKVPSDVETVLAEHEKLANEAPKNAKELKKELVKDNDRIKQFKSSGKALDEFIQCVLGSK